MLLERQRRGAQRRPSQKAQTLVLRTLLVLLIVLPLHTALGLTNGLALTPPMGWNSWNKYHCNINETIIRSIADAFVTSGLQAAGYQFVNIDDCWQVSRDTNGVIVADSGKFPSASAPSLPIPQAAFSCCNYRRTKVLWCLHPVCGRLILSKLTSSQYEPAMPGSFWN